MAHRIGYSRVSTTDQDTTAQQLRLEAAGCRRIFTETISSRVQHRPQLSACLEYLREGDALVVVRLDRVARSTRELLEIAQGLEERGIDLVVLDQAIDTATPAGKLMFSVLAAIAQFERDLIRERTMDGAGPSAGQDRRQASHHRRPEGPAGEAPGSRGAERPADRREHRGLAVRRAAPAGQGGHGPCLSAAPRRGLGAVVLISPIRRWQERLAQSCSCATRLPSHPCPR
jgi:hypothetical protein